MKFHTLVVTQIISIVLHHVHVNFMITVEIFVKWVYNFYRSSEIKDEYNDSKYYVSNHLFYYPDLVLFYYFACFLASVICQFSFISQPWWPTFWLSPSEKKNFDTPVFKGNSTMDFSWEFSRSVTFTCSKLTIETLERSVKYIQS